MSELSNLCDIVIFGGHGDLAFRKLMPALFHLRNDGYLNHNSRIVSTTRSHISREDHIELTRIERIYG